MTKKKKSIQIHLPKIVPVDKLVELDGNSNKQSRHAFAELRKSIREEGFDESLIVRPLEDGTYEIVSGNHRFRAGKAEGLSEFPCVIRTDWDEIKADIESVRRNYVRGSIDKTAFTAQVDSISMQAALPLDTIYEQMGFEDADAFAKLYEKEKAQQDEIISKAVTSQSSIGAVKILDDLGTVLSTILAQYGHTVPQSFIVFPAGNKHHMYVAVNPALKQVLQMVAEQSVYQGIDINIALAGLLKMGAAHSNFFNGDGDGAVEVNAKGMEEPEGVTSDLEPIRKKHE